MRAAGRLHRKCSERGEAPSARMASKGVEPDTSTVRLSRGSDRLQPLTRTRGHRDMSSGSAGRSKGHRALRLLRAPPRAMRTDSKGEGPSHPRRCLSKGLSRKLKPLDSSSGPRPQDAQPRDGVQGALGQERGCKPHFSEEVHRPPALGVPATRGSPSAPSFLMLGPYSEPAETPQSPGGVWGGYLLWALSNSCMTPWSPPTPAVGRDDNGHTPGLGGSPVPGQGRA